uniref:DUF3905 domain-containing protein n=1 Tax=Anaerobacillus isosaccharinicus TaxID=1532552 RepID=A0A1S2L6L2_9BACI
MREVKKQRKFDPNPETPLDNWSVELDPAIMSGDHWAEEENSPLEQLDFFDDGHCEDVSAKKEHPYHMFTHPTLNVSYGNIKRDNPKSE